jgi:hypothetical protein
MRFSYLKPAIVLTFKSKSLIKIQASIPLLYNNSEPALQIELSHYKIFIINAHWKIAY